MYEYSTVEKQDVDIVENEIGVIAIGDGALYVGMERNTQYKGIGRFFNEASTNIVLTKIEAEKMRDALIAMYPIQGDIDNG